MALVSSEIWPLYKHIQFDSTCMSSLRNVFSLSLSADLLWPGSANQQENSSTWKGTQKVHLSAALIYSCSFALSQVGSHLSLAEQKWLTAQHNQCSKALFYRNHRNQVIFRSKSDYTSFFFFLQVWFTAVSFSSASIPTLLKPNIEWTFLCGDAPLTNQPTNQPTTNQWNQGYSTMTVFCT